jgi:hypothetical protein
LTYLAGTQRNVDGLAYLPYGQAALFTASAFDTKPWFEVHVIPVGVAALWQVFSVVPEAVPKSVFNPP